MINSADIKRLKKDALCEIYSGDDLRILTLGVLCLNATGSFIFAHTINTASTTE